MQPQLEVHPVGWDAVLEVARHQLTVCVCVFLWGGGLALLHIKFGPAEVASLVPVMGCGRWPNSLVSSWVSARSFASAAPPHGPQPPDRHHLN